jgi:hypothetical protein
MRRSNAAVVNAASLGLGLIEMAVFGCACYGFPYIQYILEAEKLFMNEYCTEEEISVMEMKSLDLEIIEDFTNFLSLSKKIFTVPKQRKFLD